MALWFVLPTVGVQMQPLAWARVAYIRVIDEDEAEGKLFQTYDNIQRTRGRVSNVLRIQSLDPKGLQAHLDLYMAHIYRAGGLTRAHREMIAVAVSATNGCTYCVTHHAEALGKYVDKAVVDALAKDPAGAKLDGKARSLVDYAVGITKDPANGRKDAVEALRAAGFSDEDILHATEVAAYFNYVNRLVHGLGVELEDDDDRDYHY